jgi:glycosyltransferase involved in cell wall biosynthesis
VLKYRTPPPAGVAARTVAVPNGVATPSRIKSAFGQSMRVVMSGRIAPSKHLLEALAAMRLLWARCPHAELHVLGPAEPRHARYAEAFAAAAGADLGMRVFLHGAAFGAPEALADYDAALVLGTHQGCPNAVLEALAAGLPVVANDSGGTREAVRDARTGVLLQDCEPSAIARALERVLVDARFARRLSVRGRRHAARRFSIPGMKRAYLALFESLVRELQ